MNNLTEALWLFLPAAVANATPVVANFVPGLKRWDAPIDGGRSFENKRLLGDNKRWRGVICGVILAGLTAYIQSRLYASALTPFMQTLFGLSIGFGALYGDAVESFFKRRRNLSPGQSWFPFDQLDYVIGGLIAGLPYGLFGSTETLAIVVVYFAAHLITVFVSHHLGIRDRPI